MKRIDVICELIRVGSTFIGAMDVVGGRLLELGGK